MVEEGDEQEIDVDVEEEDDDDLVGGIDGGAVVRQGYIDLM